MRKWLIFGACALVALLNLYVFGSHHVPSWGDASQYDAYAVHLLQNHFYSTDGNTFSILREPAYPAFLAGMYALFGVDNFIFVFVAQALFVGVAGFLMYALFARAGHERLGLLAALLITANPYYGYYSFEILTEVSFAFILGLLLYLCVRIAAGPDKAPLYAYVALGLLCAVGALTRAQLLFFLPFLFLCYAVFIRQWSSAIFKKMLLAGLAFGILVGSWVSVVHYNLGTYSITAGRQEIALYFRADRAKLSYKELTHYAIDWLKRSASGGTVDSALLEDNEYHVLGKRYSAIATSTAAITAIEKQSIDTILKNPGHYLYGNVIEVMKLVYIEHDYTDSMNRYMRALVYVVTYGLFLVGLGLFIWYRKHTPRELKILALTPVLFIIYNATVLSFFDVIPRYNTPYLFCYAVTGLAGIAAFAAARKQHTAHTS